MRRIGYSVGSNRATDMITPNIILRVVNRLECHQLGMRGDGMVRLDKSLQHHFPISADHFLNVHRHISLLVFPLIHVLRQDFHVLLKPRRLIIHIDKDPPTPSRYSHLGQCIVFLFYMRKVPLAWRTIEFTVERPGPSMIRAAQVFGVSRTTFQCPAPMQTRIVKPFQFSGLCTC